MKTFYSVELEATGYEDDTFNGTFEECMEYIKENDYSNGEARIAKIVDDGDPTVEEIITEW